MRDIERAARNVDKSDTPTVSLGNNLKPFPERNPSRKTEETSDERISFGSGRIRQNILRPPSHPVPDRKGGTKSKDESRVT